MNVKMFVLLGLLVFVGGVNAAYWTNDPNLCPQTYAAQSCIPIWVCGVTPGDVAQCYNTALINAPVVSAVSETLYSGAFDGGYLIDCYSYDGSVPHCDNAGAEYCNSNATCNAINNKTNCIENLWAASGSSNCSDNCKSGFIQCFSATDCDIQIGSACSSGGLPGTWSASCACDTTPQHFITGINALGSTSNPLLWGTQFGNGVLMNLTQNASNYYVTVNNSGCLFLNTPEGASSTCNLTGSGGVAGGEPLQIANFTMQFFSPCPANYFVGGVNESGGFNCYAPTPTPEVDPVFTVNLTAGVTGNWTPFTDGVYDLGNSTNTWNNIYVSGLLIDPTPTWGGSCSVKTACDVGDYSPWDIDSEFIYQKDSALAVLIDRNLTVGDYYGVNSFLNNSFLNTSCIEINGSTVCDWSAVNASGGSEAYYGVFNETEGVYVYNSTDYKIDFNETLLNQTIDARVPASDYSPWQNETENVTLKDSRLKVLVASNLTVGSNTVNTTIIQDEVTTRNVIGQQNLLLKANSNETASYIGLNTNAAGTPVTRLGELTIKGGRDSTGTTDIVNISGGNSPLMIKPGGAVVISGGQAALTPGYADVVIGGNLPPIQNLTTTLGNTTNVWHYVYTENLDDAEGNSCSVATACSASASDYSPWTNDSTMVYQKNVSLGVNVTWLNATDNVTTPLLFTGNVTLNAGAYVIEGGLRARLVDLFFLPGKSGGQIAYGGLDAGDSLFLRANPQTAGAGGNVEITAQDSSTNTGGDVKIDAGTSDANDGGDVLVTAGKSNVGAGAFRGGDVNLTAGDSDSAMQGGDVNLRAGESANGKGGAALIRGGDAAGDGSNGGATVIRGGDALSDSVDPADGGGLTLRGGNANATNDPSDAGEVFIRGGNGGNDGPEGGPVWIEPGVGYRDGDWSYSSIAIGPRNNRPTGDPLIVVNPSDHSNNEYPVTLGLSVTGFDHRFQASYFRDEVFVGSPGGETQINDSYVNTSFIADNSGNSCSIAAACSAGTSETHNGVFNETEGVYVYNSTAFKIDFNETKLNSTIDDRNQWTRAATGVIHPVNNSDNVSIGSSSTAPFPLTFATIVGEKIAFTASSPGHYGIGLQGNQLQYYTTTLSGNHSFGYGSSASFTEKVNITGSGNVLAANDVRALNGLNGTKLTIHGTGPVAATKINTFSAHIAQPLDINYVLPMTILGTMNYFLQSSDGAGSLTWAMEADPEFTANFTRWRTGGCASGYHYSAVGGDGNFTCSADSSGTSDYSPFTNGSTGNVYQKDATQGVNVTWLNSTNNVTTPQLIGGVEANKNLTILPNGDSTRTASYVTVNDTGIVSMGNQSRVHVVVSANQNCQPGYVNINYGVTSYDAQGEFSLTNDVFTPKQAGYYQINCHVQVANLLASQLLTLRIVVNGTISWARTDINQTVKLNYYGLGVSDVIYIGANDNASCQCSHSIGLPIIVSSDYDYFSAHRLS